MGGLGSGRPSYHWSNIENSTELDVGFLKREGALQKGARGEITWSRRGKQTSSIGYRMIGNDLVLIYTYGGETVIQPLIVTWLACTYGGDRPYFVCTGCQKRVTKLYGAGRDFLCRHCYGLKYSSQSEQRTDRQLRKARKIHEKLECETGLGTEPVKPKHMHYKTYFRLLDELHQNEQAVELTDIISPDNVSSWTKNSVPD